MTPAERYEYDRDRYLVLREARLCVRCKGEAPKGSYTCVPCREKKTQRRKEAQAEAWRERPCAHCQELFVPKTRSQKDARKAKCCSMSCAAKNASKKAHAESWAGRTFGSTCREMTPAELVVCGRCGLRGPHECLGPIWTYGTPQGGAAYVGRRLR